MPPYEGVPSGYNVALKHPLFEVELRRRIVDGISAKLSVQDFSPSELGPPDTFNVRRRRISREFSDVIQQVIDEELGYLMSNRQFCRFVGNGELKFIPEEKIIKRRL